MIHVIIQDGLYDRDFVNAWCVGFDRLREHVRDYTPDRVSTPTWVPARDIRNSARAYAEAHSASIQWGNAIDHGRNSFQTARALCTLRTLTANLDRAGGHIQATFPLQRVRDPFGKIGSRFPVARVCVSVYGVFKGLFQMAWNHKEFQPAHHSQSP